MAENPERRRNRIGCFVILAILVVSIALYIFAGFSADPGNALTESIPALH